MLRPLGHYEIVTPLVERFVHTRNFTCINIQLSVQSKVKVKWSPYTPGVTQRVGRGIALFFHDRDTRRGWVFSSTPRPHFTPGKDPIPILQEAGWAPGPVWTGRKSRLHRDSIPDHPARSQSLYQVELPGPLCVQSTKACIRYYRGKSCRDMSDWSCLRFRILKMCSNEFLNKLGCAFLVLYCDLRDHENTVIKL